MRIITIVGGKRNTCFFVSTDIYIYRYIIWRFPVKMCWCGNDGNWTGHGHSSPSHRGKTMWACWFSYHERRLLVWRNHRSWKRKFAKDGGFRSHGGPPSSRHWNRWRLGLQKPWPGQVRMNLPSYSAPGCQCCALQCQRGWKDGNEETSRVKYFKLKTWSKICRCAWYN